DRHHEGARVPGHGEGRARGAPDPHRRPGRRGHQDHAGADLHLRRAHRRGAAAGARGPPARPRERRRGPRDRRGRHVGAGRGPGRGQRRHPRRDVRQLPGGPHLAVRRRARRVPLHRPEGRQHGGVLPRQRRRLQPRADPRGPRRRGRGLRLRHALDGAHRLRERGHPGRWIRGDLRAGRGGALGDARREAARRRARHHRRGPGQPGRAVPALRRRRGHRPGVGERGPADHRHDRRRRGLHRGGARQPGDVRGRALRHARRRDAVQRRLPRGVRPDGDHAAGRVGPGHGRQEDRHRPLPRRAPAHGSAHAPAGQRQDRPHADDHPPDGHRRRRGGLRHDGPQARRDHQAADQLL
ncbi:MAG: Threonine dehydrogenase and related Zn-dependent dehydrogenases, partial [uncultured Actinomycetospora sp.]